jgi:outer membrane receptor protein involved in Fe transport
VNPSGGGDHKRSILPNHLFIWHFDFIAGLRYDTYTIQGKFDTDGPGPGTARLCPLDVDDLGLHLLIGRSVAAYAGPFMPGYTLVDLFTSYRSDSGFEIGASVVNLFKADYRPALTTPTVPFDGRPYKTASAAIFQTAATMVEADVPVDCQGTILADRLLAAGIIT